MRFLISFACLIGLFTTPVLAQTTSEERPNVEAVEDSDQEMNDAIATARRTLPSFLDVLANPPRGASRIGFKFPLSGWEHIWVYDVRRDGDFLTGKLANVPMQEEWSVDDPVRVPLSHVSDWAWMNANGVMEGHFTTRVLLDRIDPQRADLIARGMGWK